MNILVSGSRGLIGSALVSSLSASGHQITHLVRSARRPNSVDVSWNPVAGQIDAAVFDGKDAVVHLAGESISQRWTPGAKQRIRDSRIDSTRLLAKTLAGLQQRPNVLVCASAIGYYGNRGSEVLTEDSAPGSGFLSDVCHAWESAAELAAEAGIRVVRLRFGIVLSASGGALQKMLPPFRMGVGGRLGDGQQYMSWIALDDVVGIITQALDSPNLSGPVNTVAPNAVTNLEFTKTLSRVLSRPTIFPLPAFAVRLAFGEMGQELLLSSTRVDPAKLKSAGYAFRYPELEGALRHVLAK